MGHSILFYKVILAVGNETESLESDSCFSKGPKKKGMAIINMHYISSVQYPDGLGSSIHCNHCNCTSGSISSAVMSTNLFWDSIDNCGMTYAIQQCNVQGVLYPMWLEYIYIFFLNHNVLLLIRLLMQEIQLAEYKKMCLTCKLCHLWIMLRVYTDQA